MAKDEKKSKDVGKKMFNDVTDSTIDARNAVDEFYKSLRQGGKKSKPILDELAKLFSQTGDATKKASRDVDDFADSMTKGQKEFSSLQKTLASYDGPRFKASGMITEELSNQLSYNEMLAKSKIALNELDARAASYSKLLSTDTKTLEGISQQILNSEIERLNALESISDATSAISNLDKQIIDNQTKINLLTEMGLENSDAVKKLENEINNAITEKNDLTKQSYELEDKITNLLQDQQEQQKALVQENEKLDFSTRISQSDKLKGIFSELNELTDTQTSLQGDLAKKMQELENSAHNIGTEQYRQLDFSDEISDRLQEQRTLEQARESILDSTNGLTDDQRKKAMDLVQANININQAQLKQFKSLQEAAGAYDMVREKSEGLRDTMMTPVDKLFGIVPSGLSKMLGLDTIKKQISDKVFKSITDGFMSAGGGVSGFFSAASAGASTLIASLLPLLPLLLSIAAVVGIVKLFMDADKAVSDLAKNLNISYKEASKVHGASMDMANELGIAGINSKEIEETMTELGKSMGMNVAKMGALGSAGSTVAEKMNGLVATSAMLTKQYGLSADENVQLNQAAAITGTSMEKMALQAEALGADGLVPAADIMKEIGKTSKRVLFNFKGNGPALAAAVKQAKLMGTTLDAVANAGENLMNIESSVTAENKARLMLGRDINMNAARYYAMTGDTVRQMEEMKKQAGSVADYDKMGAFQKKALAEALGISNDELAEMMGKQRELEKMGISEQKLQEIMQKDKAGQLNLEKELAGLKDDEARKMLKAKIQEQQRAGIQEKLGSTIQKITDLLYKMVAPILPIIDNFVDSLGDGSGVLSGMSDTFSGIGKFVSNVLFPILKIAFTPMMITIKMVSKIISKIGEAMNDIFGPVKEGEESFSMLGSIATVLGKIFSGIGVVIADYIMAPFMRIAGIIGGVIKIFKGDFAGGIKQIGGAILSFIMLPFEAIGDFIDEVFGTNLVDSVKGVFSKIGDGIINILGGVWDLIAGIFTFDGDRILEGIVSIGDGLYDVLVQPFMDAWDWITGFFGGNSPSKLGESIVTGISSVAESLFDFITWPFRKAWDFIGNLFGMGDLGSSIIDSMKNIFGKVVNTITKILGGAWDVITGIFTFDGDKILSGLSGIGESIKSIFTDAWNWITGLFSGIGKKIIDGVSNLGSGIWNSITGAFKSSYDWVTGSFGNIGHKIVDGIKSVGSSIVSSITKPFSDAWDSVSGWLGFSPSELGNGIVKGISSVGGDVETNLTKPFDSAEQKVTKSASNMANSVAESTNEVTSTAKPAVTAVTQQPAQVVNKTTPTATETSTTTQPATNSKNVEALLKELITKIDQPVVLKIGEKAIAEMQSVMSLKKSYSSNVNGYRA